MTNATCRGCGDIIVRAKPTDRRQYHGPDCRPRCAVESCEKPLAANGWCSAHARRAIRTGDPVSHTGRGRNEGSCSVAGCESPMRKRTWCAAHYSMWKRTGEVKPFGYKWIEPLAGCLACGKPVGERAQSRRYCSSACDMIVRRWGGIPPDATECVVCDEDIPLRRPDGRRLKFRRLCRRCARHSRKHGLSVVQLADRDGLNCGICHEPVDLDAATDDLMRPSVDHIWPRALGGTNDPSNLQLAHLICNIHKRDRVPA